MNIQGAIGSTNHKNGNIYYSNQGIYYWINNYNIAMHCRTVCKKERSLHLNARIREQELANPIRSGKKLRPIDILRQKQLNKKLEKKQVGSSKTRTQGSFSEVDEYSGVIQRVLQGKPLEASKNLQPDYSENFSCTTCPVCGSPFVDNVAHVFNHVSQCCPEYIRHEVWDGFLGSPTCTLETLVPELYRIHELEKSNISQLVDKIGKQVIKGKLTSRQQMRLVQKHTPKIKLVNMRAFWWLQEIRKLAVLKQSDEAIQVVYEDTDMIVVNKPANVHTLEKDAPNQSGRSLQAFVEEYVDSTMYAVNRLEAALSGLVIFGKSQEVADFLGQQFRDNNVQKQYIGLTLGTPPAPTQTINQPIAPSPHHQTLRQIHPSGIPGTTHVQLLHTIPQQPSHVAPGVLGTHLARTLIDSFSFYLGSPASGGSRDEQSGAQHGKKKSERDGSSAHSAKKRGSKSDGWSSSMQVQQRFFGAHDDGYRWGVPREVQNVYTMTLAESQRLEAPGRPETPTDFSAFLSEDTSMDLSGGSVGRGDGEVDVGGVTWRQAWTRKKMVEATSKLPSLSDHMKSAHAVLANALVRVHVAEGVGVQFPGNHGKLPGSDLVARLKWFVKEYEAALQNLDVHMKAEQQDAMTTSNAAAEKLLIESGVCMAFSGVSLVRCVPETSLTHQIRLHLVHAGLPVLGDVKYGVGVGEYVSRAMLHQHKLKLLHPGSGETVEFTAPLHEDFQRIAGEMGVGVGQLEGLGQGFEALDDDDNFDFYDEDDQVQFEMEEED